MTAYYRKKEYDRKIKWGSFQIPFNVFVLLRFALYLACFATIIAVLDNLVWSGIADLDY